MSYSYCVDSDNRAPAQKSHNNGSNRQANNVQSTDSTVSPSYQYTLADVPQLAEQAASMYAQTPAEKESYLKYYTEYYTSQIKAVSSIGDYSSFEILHGRNKISFQYSKV